MSMSLFLVQFLPPLPTISSPLPPPQEKKKKVTRSKKEKQISDVIVEVMTNEKEDKRMYCLNFDSLGRKN